MVVLCRGLVVHWTELAGHWVGLVRQRQHWQCVIKSWWCFAEDWRCTWQGNIIELEKREIKSGYDKTDDSEQKRMWAWYIVTSRDHRTSWIDKGANKRMFAALRDIAWWIKINGNEYKMLMVSIVICYWSQRLHVRWATLAYWLNFSMQVWHLHKSMINTGECLSGITLMECTLFGII